MTKISQVLLCLGSVVAWCLTGCASTPKPDPMAFTAQALAATDPATVKPFAPGSSAETEAITRFKTFNSDFSASNITNNTKNVYAADVYFRDPFKEIHGEPDFEAYLLSGSSAVSQFSMNWQDVGKNGGNYYFRWVMSVKFKSDGKKQAPSLTTGISFVRFGPDGKVIFHQDYFDAGSFLYEKIPVLGAEIRFIKKRM